MSWFEGPEDSSEGPWVKVGYGRGLGAPPRDTGSWSRGDAPSRDAPWSRDREAPPRAAAPASDPYRPPTASQAQTPAADGGWRTAKPSESKVAPAKYVPPQRRNKK